MNAEAHLPHPWIELRKRQGPPKVRDSHGPGVNAKIALAITGAVGTMWCAYVFAAISLAGNPLWSPAWLVQTVQWVSQNFVQLVLLSVIIVGQNVQAVAADRRSESTYQDAEAILHECGRLHDHLQRQDLAMAAALRAVAAADPSVAALVFAALAGQDVGNSRAGADSPTMRLLKTRPRATAPAASHAATPHFEFHSDGTAAGDAAVASMQAVCEQDYAALKDVFQQADPPGMPAVVHVDTTAGGAYHLSCAGTEIWTIPDDAATLLVAEMAEVFMAQAKGWDCGSTNGEGLSRALAAVIRPDHVLGDLDGDVQGWWAAQTDFVNGAQADDQDEQSNACATLFLYYLRFQLGSTWQQIVAAGAPTLGQTYQALTGKPGTQGFSDFVALLKTIDNGGQLNVPGTGQPFPLGSVPTPTPTPAPPPAPQPAPGRGSLPPAPPPGVFAWLRGLFAWLEHEFGW